MGPRVCKARAVTTRPGPKQLWTSEETRATIAIGTVVSARRQSALDRVRSVFRVNGDARVRGDTSTATKTL